jgi:hypothetical protein
MASEEANCLVIDRVVADDEEVEDRGGFTRGLEALRSMHFQVPDPVGSDNSGDSCADSSSK